MKAALSRLLNLIGARSAIVWAAMRPWLNRVVKSRWFDVFLYGLAYAFVLVALVRIWAKYPQLLFIYRDGEYNLWISLQYAQWADPFDLTAINPLQGMTSMLVAINPYFNPGQWLFFTHLDAGAKILGAYAIYALEVLLSTFALGRVLGFSPLQSFVGSICAVLLLFPPFNCFVGLGGWFMGAPMYGHALALTNICIIAFIWLQAEALANLECALLWRSGLLICLVLVAVLAILFAAPFYNAGMLLGTGICLGCVFLSNNRRPQFALQLAAGAAIIVAFYAIGLPGFYVSAQSNAVRLENSRFLAFNWPTGSNWFNQDAIDQAWNLLCAFGVHCSRFPGWPISINTGWINGAIILGGIAAWLTRRGTIGRIGLLTSATWLGLLALAVMMSFGIVSSWVAPSFYFLMMYSLCALYASYIAALPIQLIFGRTRLAFNPTVLSSMALAMAIVLSVGLAIGFHDVPDRIHKSEWRRRSADQFDLLETRHQRTAIIDILKEEVALHPGERFRGSVATIFGTAEGSLRKAPGVRQTPAVIAWQFETFLTAAAASGSTHDLLDLWSHNIPTLSEYGQGLSRPLMFYMSRFLKSRDDEMDSHFAFPRTPNLDVLRAMGVRFVIIDAPLAAGGVTLRQTLAAGEAARLYLYELAAPNLGDFSPTRLLPLRSIDEFTAAVRADPKLFRTDAFVDAPLNVPLTPAQGASVVFEKGGVRLAAKSTGTSALLIPVQYSHCYRTFGPSNADVKIMRANLIHTLVLFKGELDLKLRWEFRWGRSACRRQDALETHGLYSGLDWKSN